MPQTVPEPPDSVVSKPTSPQLARAAQATEDAWRRMESLYGLYTSAGIAEKLGRGEDPSWTNGQRKAGKLLGVERRGHYRYPGFQVSHDGELLEVVPRLLELAREQGWSDESLALWLASPSGSMPEDRSPAELLSDHPDLVLTAARSTMLPTW